MHLQRIGFTLIEKAALVIGGPGLMFAPLLLSSVRPGRSCHGAQRWTWSPVTMTTLQAQSHPNHPDHHTWTLQNVNIRHS